MLIILIVSAAIGGWGLFWLVQAFVTGRARGVWFSAARASEPARFWLNVTVLALLVGISSAYAARAALEGGLIGGAFRARHPASTGGQILDLPVARLSPGACEESRPRVCFVEVGAAPDLPVDRLAHYASTLLGSPVAILDPIALTRQAEGLPVIDAGRFQVGTGAVERLVRTTYPTLWADRDATIVMLTGNDLWIETRPEQRYAFGTVTVRAAGGGFAIVSSARMDPAAYGHAADSAVLERRMQVMVGKYLAMLRYGATPSPDPTSPVYSAVRSPADLDRMRLFSPQR